MQAIEDKLKAGRSDTMEFLSTIDEISDLAKIAVSFANNRGGSIFVGVNSKGKLIGILREPELRLVDEIHDYIDGEIVFECIIHTVKHYFILEILISKSTSPLKVKFKGQLIYYYRAESETIEANKIIVSFLNLQKFQKSIEITNEHLSLISALDSKMNLSMLYKTIDLKPKVVDKLLSELIYSNKVKFTFMDKTLYFSKK